MGKSYRKKHKFGSIRKLRSAEPDDVGPALSSKYEGGDFLEALTKISKAGDKNALLAGYEDYAVAKGRAIAKRKLIKMANSNPISRKLYFDAEATRLGSKMLPGAKDVTTTYAGLAKTASDYALEAAKHKIFNFTS